jgi:hypothetical protein
VAENILDIVHRISYEVTGQNQITAITARFNENVQSIGRNVASLARLQQQLNATTDPARQARLQQAIQNRTRAINEQGQAITKAIENDKQFQRTLQQEIGIINEMNGRLRSLRESRDRATSTAEIRRYTNQIREVEMAQSRLSGSGGSVLGNIGSSLLQGIGIGSGIQIFDAAISKIGELISESGRLAAEVEGVRPAFDRLNNPSLLDGLREATKGTVSDLELMKQAVQFSNFGLPVNRLAEALKFARIRARETGQTVEYLVQSIVTGIGRQSPLILDNLGISARRVADEFKRTGDFSAAAFKIIQEETNKAGTDLDTFTEKLNKINATIQNEQAEFGKLFNFIKQGFVALGKDLTVDLTQGLENINRLGDSIRLQVKAEEDAAARRNAVNLDYQNKYERFLQDVGRLDINSRQQRLRNAEQFYAEDLTRAAFYYGTAIDDFRRYAARQTAAFNLLKSQLSSTPVNLAGITAENITGATRNQLIQLQSDLESQRGDLRQDDRAGIADVNRRIKAVTDAIATFDPIKPIKEKIKKPSFTAEDFAKLKEKILINYSKIIKEINEEIENNPADALVIPSLQRQAATPLNVLQSDVDKSRQQPNTALSAQLELSQDIFKFNKAQKDKELEEDKKRDEERIESSQAAYSSIVQSASLAISSILDAQVRAAELEIEYRTGTVEKAKELALRGNTEVLKAEEEQLAKATAARDAAAQRQLELNALLQASNMAVALSEAIGAVVAAAAKGDPYTIAARVIAAVAALVGGVAALSSAFSTANQGFYTGGFTGNGNKMEPAGTVHKGEFVFNKETTSKHRELFEAIHKGENPAIAIAKYPTYIPIVSQSINNKNEISSLRKELKEIKEAVLMSTVEVNANQNLDANGLNQTVETIKRKDKHRFKR